MKPIYTKKKTVFGIQHHHTQKECKFPVENQLIIFKKNVHVETEIKKRKSRNSFEIKIQNELYSSV